MADYYPLISRAVAGLDKSTGEARRALYERARKALVDQLRAIDPPLSEADITRERLALEESIRKVETEAVRQAPRQEHAPHIPASPRAEDFQRASPPRNPSATPTPRSERNWLDRKPGASREGIKGFKDVVADAESLGGAAAQAGRNARETYSSVPSPSPEFDRLEPRLDEAGAPRTGAREPQGPEVRSRAAGHPPGGERRPPEQPRESEVPRATERRSSPVRADLGPVIGAQEQSLPRPRGEARVLDPQPVPESVRRAAERGEHEFDEEEAGEDGKPLFGWVMKTLIALGVVVLLIAGTVGLIYWKGGDLVALTKSMFSRQPAATVQTTPPRSTKIPDRVGQSEPPPAAEAMVAQRAVLYEEGEANDQSGRTYTGTALWRTEAVAGANGQPADRGVRGDIDIPDRGMKVVWSLRRNTDKDMPASHTISIQFVLPPNFQHGGISEIRGVLMKQSEQTRGTSLMGVSVKVTNNYFLVGLSALDAERQRNIQMLKERGWFDIAVVYTDGKRAILAVEKGTPGDNAFKEAFAAWGQ